MRIKITIPTICLLILSHLVVAQSKHTISGYIKDASNGEVLVGASVYVKENGNGALTNTYGFYSITLPEGSYTFEVSYVGYQKIAKALTLEKDTKLEWQLDGESQELNEVVVTSEGDLAAKIQSVEMSTAKLDIAIITKMPAFLGEVDVIKSLQMLPGVATVGEGTSGFNVRGGSVGQNLIVQDEAPVYNSTHMLGFFSAFNPDAVKEVKLYKGAMPSRFGGRLASILDIHMRDGNNKKFEATGGIGTIFSRLSVEGPIVKEKGSFILSGRRSYIDVLGRPFLDVFEDGGALNFYDLTGKVNYKLNDRNKIFASGYLGRDKFYFARNEGFAWGNSTATVRLNHLFTEKLFANITGVYSHYNYSLEFGDDARNQFTWKSAITNFIFKPELSFYISTNNEINFGGEAQYYYFEPANAAGVSDGVPTYVSLQNKKNLETAIYINHNVKLSEVVSIEYGLRVSNFQYFGPGSADIYNDTIPGIRRSVVSTREYGSGESMASYTNLEPRFAVKVGLTEESSVKASYNKMSQYLHLVSNTTASNPLDVWTPSTQNIKPEIGHQITAGYFQGIDNMWEISAEAYLRLTENQIDYIDGADILFNQHLEGDLLSGKGRAYGLEFYLQKKKGKFTGWISYTLGRSELQVTGINRNEWYPTRYDQTHNLKIASFYDLSKRWSVSANFTFNSGTPTNFPTSRYVVQGILIPENASSSRNKVRMPSYNRLDVSFRLEGKEVNRKGQVRKNRDYWVFSVYNLYARHNPFSVYFSQSSDRPAPGAPLQSEATQLSVIGTFVPAVSYNFKF